MNELIPVSDIPPQVLQAKQRLGIVGNTPALTEAVQRAIKVAPIDLSVLVTGESGTGKEFFPQIIHQYSPRKHSKYIAVNCGAIPEGTIDSELFGHEKGSFTGAVASRKGYFEEADGGTIFLDEVAELPLTTQARLLRVLETGEFLKVGSSVVQKTNIRIVAATNVDMAQAVAEGKFREDLYYRLSTVQISIPPLRDRGTDILLLARKFAADFAERYRMPKITFGEDTRPLMLAYRWPGNVRQLKNIVEQMALFEAGTEIDSTTLSHYLPKDAPEYSPLTSVQPAVRQNAYEREREMLFNLIFRLRSEVDEMHKQLEELKSSGSGRKFNIERQISNNMSSALTKIDKHPTDTPNIIDIDVETVDEPASSPANSTPDTLEDTERETIRRSLQRNDGRRKATAKELNISERTLYRKIKEYGLEQ